MAQNSSNNSINLSPFNIGENIIDQLKQDILQGIKQELNQNIRTRVMSSFFRDNNAENSSNSSKMIIKYK